MKLNRRIFAVVVVALIAGAVLLLAILYLGSGGQLEVVSAEYGVPGRMCRAEPAFMKRVSEGCGGFRPRCLVSVGSGWCGDPAPGLVKTLTVEYKCGETPKRATAIDGAGVTLACP